MTLFGPDPKDEMIALLLNERDYLRVKVGELESQLLAINNAHAFRLMNRRESDPPLNPILPSDSSPFDQKAQVFTPKQTLSDIEHTFRKGD